ncbi:hypothetical protein NGM99_21115 [Mesorhizobium sp. RP14(2022)]|uniref:Uncharacterized protein n=1 Tax=Mesorhizobium liriopis TaxID=2953882 RepID=A0ABT1CBT7_9HYPH|nr:hypothetical protein [Mesorhizobium liriopis]MCO6052293.1 hypothetical protein [Mesorhizobium liriopis]
MIGRTTHTIAHFSDAFWLGGLAAQAPAGDYRVDHEWEIVESGSQSGYRRSGSFIHVPSISTRSNMTQLVPISANELLLAVETAATM